jgi:hypothetical protein
MLRGSVALRATVIATALAFLAPVVTPARAGDCSKTSVGFQALTDLGAGSYKGKQGGLYPGGSNARPLAHTNQGLALAKGQVVPRRADGRIDAKGGKLVFLSVGMSNAEQEFRSFVPMANADPRKSPRVVVVNGAQAGQEASEVARATRKYWQEVENRLAAAGVTDNQVGAVWLKEADGKPSLPFPQDAEKLESDLEAIVKIIKEKFPNAWLVYVSTRSYGGYATTDVNPEPWAYQTGFAFKWLVERQLTGALPVGTQSAPWLSWGPYFWADGTRGSKNGLKWFCSDFLPDGTHPSRSGVQKVDDMLLSFVHTDATARIWYSGLSQTPGTSSPGTGLEGSPPPTPSASPTVSASSTPPFDQGALPASSKGSAIPWILGALAIVVAGAAGVVLFLRSGRTPDQP